VRDVLADNPVLLLFVVAAAGFVLGRIRVGGFSLGVAAVLFAGIAAGAVDERFELPELVQVLGLAVFVYTTGLASGPGFVAALRRRGLRDNGLVLGVLLSALGLTVLAAKVFGFTDATAAGLFSGSLTNTPALAAVLERLGPGHVDPVVAYSVTYPLGVIGMLVAIYVLQRRFHTDYAAEAQSSPALAAFAGEPLVQRNVTVLHEQDVGLLDDVVVSRLRRGDELSVPAPGDRLHRGDVVHLVGTRGATARAVAGLGQLSSEELALDRSAIDMRRVFVSNPSLIGTPVSELALGARFGAIATRVRRGDVDLLADDLVLELGDRVRVVAPRDRMPEVSRFFGDSYRALGEVDVMTFSIGIALGLLLGLVPFPMPGGAPFKLGVAGGPLIAGLVLGARHRTGPLVWQLPYSANLTLRQFGTVLFLAGVGTRSGQAFRHTIGEGRSLQLVAAGASVTLFAAVATLVIGHRLLKMPMGVAVGVLAGLQTQPAVLAFAAEQAGNDLPNLGYTRVYATAMITKILLAQLLLSFL
jgi:putative transport protein